MPNETSPMWPLAVKLAMAVVVFGHVTTGLTVGGWLGAMTAFSGLVIAAFLPVVYEEGVRRGA